MNMDSILALVGRIGFTSILVDVSLKTTALLAVTCISMLFLRRAGAAVRHLVWSLALAGTLAMPLLSSWLPDWQLDGVPQLGGVAERAAAPEVAAVPAAAEITAAAPAITARSPQTGPLASSAAKHVETREDGAGFARGIGWRTWVVLAWMAGAAAVFAGLLAGLTGIWYLRRSASVVRSGPLADLLRSLAAEIGLRRPVTLLRSRGAAMPMTWGCVHPVVLLPHDAERWPAERRRAVLLHELAHVKRHDCLLQIVAQLACSVYWFNPLVWIAAARLRLERESACDDQVLCAGSKASDYAHLLLEMARALRPAAARLAPTVAMAQPSQLSTRLLAILDGSRRRPLLTRRLAVLVWLAVTLVSLPLAAVGPKVPRRDARSQATAEELLERARQLNRAALEAQDRVAREQRAFQEAARRAARVPSSNPALQERARAELEARSAERAAALEKRLASEAMAQQLADMTAAQAQAALEFAQQVAVRRHGRKLGFLDFGKFNKGTWSSVNEIDGQMQISVGDGDSRIRAESEGEIQFNDDGTEILSISRDGYFQIEERKSGDKRQLLIETKDGKLEYQYKVNGEDHAYDGDARAWFGRTLETLYRRTGWNAEKRIRRLLDKGGVDAVLEEATQLGSDYTRRQYYTAALQVSDLSPAVVQRIIEQAGRDIDSDYELAELLVAAGKRYPLDAGTRTAYVQAARTLGSDYEKRRVLSSVLEHGQTSVEETSAVLEMAGSIGSDYELAELLIQLLESQPRDRALDPAFLEATRGLASDYEHRRVLSALLERPRLGAPLLLSILKTAPDIGSEYERAELLVQLAHEQGITPELRQPFLEAARTLASEYERGRVLNAAAENGL